MSSNFNQNGAAKNPKPTIEQPHVVPLDQAVAEQVTHDHAGEGGEKRRPVAPSLNDRAASAPAAVDSDPFEAGTRHVSSDTGASASGTSSGVARPAGEPAATEVMGSDEAVSLAQTTADLLCKPAKVGAPGRAPRAAPKAHRKRDIAIARLNCGAGAATVAAPVHTGDTSPPNSSPLGTFIGAMCEFVAMLEDLGPTESAAAFRKLPPDEQRELMDVIRLARCLADGFSAANEENGALVVTEEQAARIAHDCGALLLKFQARNK